MGLPLHNPTSFTSLTTGAFSGGGPSATADSDPDSDPLEPLCRSSYRSRHAQYLRRSGRDNSARLANRQQQTQFKTLHHHHHHHHRLRTAARHRHRAHAAAATAATAETHTIKPHHPCWTADADEGYALARSWSVQLPGEEEAPARRTREERHQHSGSGSGSGSGRSSRNSSTSSGEERRRPPSLERQDAFRDERTVKRPPRPRSRQRRSGSDSFGMGGDESRGYDEEEEEVQVAELYRMGLLYDDEYERGEGFSLDRIVREEPVYSVSVRPARRGRREERADFVSLAMDLAFSALGEDEELAEWLLSGSSCSLQGAALDVESRPWEAAMHDTPRLTVIYELADDAVSEVSAGDFLDSVSVSEVSYVGGEEEWAMLDGCNGNDNAATATVASPLEEAADGDDVDPWVVLGHDGS
ncbi:hypothetical protein C8A00DRAFT_46239 [Chaetomidium leptoderma]|uniref:Uncharacterized protein n=1 Tax=Chaetomidium leptoderma TaxID=669021 RepID=A0AAN6VF61_9PEZI|nr:hypothetical protein C8A00DRAFT_46239 [Chaetomidium leptoderma]